MFGFQAAGADPIVRGEVVRRPQTVASAIRIGNPASWSGAEDAARSSHGGIRAVGDDDIEVARHLLASEGIFVELAAAASVAGLLALDAEGAIGSRATVVCVLTGHGLKDPESALASAGTPRRVQPDVASILAALEVG
jgi:threonine synthase